MSGTFYRDDVCSYLCTVGTSFTHECGFKFRRAKSLLHIKATCWTGNIALDSVLLPTLHLEGGAYWCMFETRTNSMIHRGIFGSLSFISSMYQFHLPLEYNNNKINR